jgi:hypothetical protein
MQIKGRRAGETVNVTVTTRRCPTYGIICTLISWPSMTPVSLAQIRAALHGGAESLMLGPIAYQRPELIRMVDWALADRYITYVLADAAVGDRITLPKIGQTMTVHAHDNAMGVVRFRSCTFTADQYLPAETQITIEPLTRRMDDRNPQFARKEVARAGRSVD